MMKNQINQYAQTISISGGFQAGDSYLASIAG